MNHVDTRFASQRTDIRSFIRCGGNQDGFALITSLLILLVLTMVVVSGLRTTMIEENISGNQKIAATALFGAEQGVSRAIDGLFSGDIEPGAENDTSWSETGTFDGSGYDTNYKISPLIRNGATVIDEDNRRYFVIESTGTSDTGAGQRDLEVAIALEWGAASNVAGFVGCRGIVGDSNVVSSSYSSSGAPSNGDRGDMHTTDANAFLYLDGSSDMDINGEIRSTGAIYMKSDALVRGNAMANLQVKIEDTNADVYGDLWTNGSYIGDDDSVHQTIHEGPSVVPNPVVPFPDCDPLGIDDRMDTNKDAILANLSHDQISVGAGGSWSGNPSTIPAGNYWFNNVTLESETVNISGGKVRMYITGDFRMKSEPNLNIDAGSSLEIYIESGVFEMDSNSDANYGGIPANLQVWSRAVNTMKDDKDWRDDEPDVWDSGDAKVILNSNSRFYGLIYAPRAHVYLDSNNEVWGSVRGRFATTLSNFDFTYDEDLDKLYTGNPTDYKLVYWVEEYPE